MIKSRLGPPVPHATEDGWLPIETAPKRTRVLVTGGGKSKAPGALPVVIARVIRGSKGNLCFTDEGHLYMGAKYWAPLPDLPA